MSLNSTRHIQMNTLHSELPLRSKWLLQMFTERFAQQKENVLSCLKIFMYLFILHKSFQLFFPRVLKISWSYSQHERMCKNTSCLNRKGGIKNFNLPSDRSPIITFCYQKNKNLPTLYSIFPSSISFCSRIRRISGFEVAIAHAAFPAS